MAQQDFCLLNPHFCNVLFSTKMFSQTSHTKTLGLKTCLYKLSLAFHLILVAPANVFRTIELLMPIRYVN